jgi:hypothetical protein
MLLNHTKDDSTDEEDDDDVAPGGGEGEGSQSGGSEGGEAEESGRDLDADMTDMDEAGNLTATTAQTDLSVMTEEDGDDEEDLSDDDMED